jgi:hypothetical protein
MTLQELRAKYPNWEIDEPHFCHEREGSGAGEVGWDAHWRQFAGPRGASSRYTVTAFSSQTEGEVKCLEDMAIKLTFKDAAWKAEM